MKDNEAAEKAWKIIDSIMKKESIDEVTLERQYLPEIFDSEVLELSKDDGLPTLKPSIILHLKLKGILNQFFGSVIKFYKWKLEGVKNDDFIIFEVEDHGVHDFGLKKLEITVDQFRGNNARDILDFRRVFVIFKKELKIVA